MFPRFILQTGDSMGCGWCQHMVDGETTKKDTEKTGCIRGQGKEDDGYHVIILIHREFNK